MTTKFSYPKEAMQAIKQSSNQAIKQSSKQASKPTAESASVRKGSGDTKKEASQVQGGSDMPTRSWLRAARAWPVVI
ncbi:hypothetical protein EYC84_000867 [Monilinia fructicola]|uniref:Uncharacterized protein n=1 Tax=Monilinia fructicola TaxID=38448 RepID=A0A5M9JI72_MONFR|nr:hypothetical protein EYC84_000867 [Monilinia fructicola]